MVLFLPQINLIFQILILVVISASMRSLKKRRNSLSHGKMMALAVTLNMLSFALVMGPSMLGLQHFIVSKPLNIISMVTLIHASLGAVAEILGIWVAVSWRLESTIAKCVRKRKIMQVTLVLWLISLFSGFLLYILLYTI